MDASVHPVEVGGGAENVTFCNVAPLMAGQVAIDCNCFCCVVGYVCPRVDVQTGGCCNVYSPSTKHYACDTCLSNGCCAIYEFCISCCVDPEKVPVTS